MLLEIFIQILFILHGFPSPVSAQHQRYKCVPLKQRLNVKLPPKCFSLCLKVWCHLKVWKWESWRRPLCKPAPRPPSGSPPSPCLPRSDLYLFNQRTFSPRASDCVTKPAATYGGVAWKSNRWHSRTNRRSGVNSGANRRLVSEASCCTPLHWGSHPKLTPPQT